ncbi:MAG: hypothetical protein JW793_15340 [Acidobacteria bacterium]|nr:hypothetical protein [Acidobacteriota bacterium]
MCASKPFPVLCLLRADSAHYLHMLSDHKVPDFRQIRGPSDFGRVFVFRGMNHASVKKYLGQDAGGRRLYVFRLNMQLFAEKIQIVIQSHSSIGPIGSHFHIRLVPIGKNGLPPLSQGLHFCRFWRQDIFFIDAMAKDLYGTRTDKKERDSDA